MWSVLTLPPPLPTMEPPWNWGVVVLLCLLLRGGHPDSCRVSIVPEAPVVELGSSVLLNCTSSCLNSSSLNWEVSVTKLGTRGPNWVTLEIPNVTEWSLELQCFGVFGGRRDITSTTLRAYRLEPPQISFAGEVVAGKPSRVTCSARAQVPPPAPPNLLLMLRGFGDPPMTHAGPSLDLGFTARPEQHGRGVRCEATLKLGTRTVNASAGVALWVWAAPHHVRAWAPGSVFAAGANVTVSCEAEGNPPPSFHWELPSNTSWQLGEGGTDVTVVAAQREHSGSYRCVATNRYGTSTASVDIRVQGSPRSPLIPVAVTLVFVAAVAVTAASWWLCRGGTCGTWRPMPDGSQLS